MAGLPRLPRLPQERAAKVRLPRVQRDRHDVPRLLVETSEGVETLPDFLMTLIKSNWGPTPQLPRGANETTRSPSRLVASAPERYGMCTSNPEPPVVRAYSHREK